METQSASQTRVSFWFLFEWLTWGMRVYGTVLEEVFIFLLRLRGFMKGRQFEANFKAKKALALGRGTRMEETTTICGEWRYYCNCSILEPGVGDGMGRLKFMGVGLILLYQCLRLSFVLSLCGIKWNGAWVTSHQVKYPEVWNASLQIVDENWASILNWFSIWVYKVCPINIFHRHLKTKIWKGEVFVSILPDWSSSTWMKSFTCNLCWNSWLHSWRLSPRLHLWFSPQVITWSSRKPRWGISSCSVCCFPV